MGYQDVKRYNASRGGHAPGHLRDALIECIDNLNPGPWYLALAMQKRWTAMSLEDRGRWLTGQLWNCRDILPGSVCADLELPIGRNRTYAVAARKLRMEM